ncbi:MAG: hypothetical protein ACQETL_05905 [Bacteroidota bacterium]
MIQIPRAGRLIHQFNIFNFLEKCTNLQIFQYVVGEEKKFCFKVDSSIDSPGQFNYSNSTISFKSTKNINLVTFGEEFFRGYQDLFYNGLGQYSNTGRSNIEFEAKLYYDLTHDGLCCENFNGETQIEYLLWLENISNGFTHIPSWSEMSDKYFYFMEKFIEEKSAYNFPIDYNLLPNALLNINNC